MLYKCGQQLHQIREPWRQVSLYKDYVYVSMKTSVVSIQPQQSCHWCMAFIPLRLTLWSLKLSAVCVTLSVVPWYLWDLCKWLFPPWCPEGLGYFWLLWAKKQVIWDTLHSEVLALTEKSLMLNKATQVNQREVRIRLILAILSQNPWLTLLRLQTRFSQIAVCCTSSCLKS